MLSERRTSKHHENMRNEQGRLHDLAEYTGADETEPRDTQGKDRRVGIASVAAQFSE